MDFTLIAAASMLLALGADPTGRGSYIPGPEPRRIEGSALPANAPEPPPTEVRVGDLAPDFAYQSHEGEWKRLKDLLRQGHVLLVFGASVKDLRRLEDEREQLLDVGVLPVAVLDVNPGKVYSTARRLGLHYSVLADPRQVIGAQFNALDPNTLASEPCWFAIDRKRRVRGLVRGPLPEQGYLALAARSLALPTAGVTLPTSR